MKIHAASMLLSVAFAAGLAGAASAGQSGGFAGEYLMRGQGFGPGDAAYQGTCSLGGDGPVYEVSCFNEATRHTYVGRGLAAGDTLAIAIGDMLRGDHGAVFVGEYLVIYERKSNGRLEGTWTGTRGSTAGTETLTPTR